MRGVRAYWVVFAYLALLTVAILITYYNYWGMWQRAESGDMDYFRRNAADIGRTIFQVIFVMQGVLVALITPALTSGAITAEREQQTYELLATSRLTAGGVVRGKLAAGVLFVILLLTCSLPLVGVSLFFGGVGLDQIFFTYLILAATALLYGGVGILASAFGKRTAAATAGAYLVAVLLVIATPLVGRMLWSNAGYREQPPLQGLSGVTAPFYAVEPENFFLWKVPAWVTGIALNGLIGLLLAVMASEQLEGFDGRRPRLRRSVATAAWTIFCLSIAGGALGQGMAGPNRSAGTLMPWELLPYYAVTAALLLLTTPVLATGQFEDGIGKRAPRWAAFLNPAAWFSDRFPAGAGLCALWAGIGIAVPFLAYTVRLAGGTPPSAWDLLQPGAVLGGVTAAATGLGFFWSAVTGPRWRVLGATYACLALLAVAPYALQTDTSLPLPPGQPEPLRWQLAYLLPIETIYRSVAQTPVKPVLMLDPVIEAGWVAAVIYAGIGLLGLLGAWGALAWRRRG